jgi:alpha-amylase
MADDLGDSHPLSLQQGGQLPPYSVETRTVGKIFVAASSPVTFYLFLSDSLNGVTVELYNDNTLVHSESPIVTGTYTPNFTGW